MQMGDNHVGMHIAMAVADDYAVGMTTDGFQVSSDLLLASTTKSTDTLKV
jgi:hypothetical protein